MKPEGVQAAIALILLGVGAAVVHPGSAALVVGGALLLDYWLGRRFGGGVR